MVQGLEELGVQHGEVGLGVPVFIHMYIYVHGRGRACVYMCV